MTDIVKQINKDHALVVIGSSVRILKERINHLGNLDMQYFSVADFKTLQKKFPNHTEERGRDINRVDYWLSSPDRREYEEVVFYPGKTPASTFNRWQGLAVAPGNGDCRLILEHLLDVICAGDQDHYQYLLAWIKWIVTTPDKKTGVAVAMRGLKGAGKGTMFSILKALFGTHQIQVSHVDQLLGKFTAHLETALVVAADEVLWPGGKRGEGVFKSLISEGETMIERKGLDAYSSRSFTNLVMATNEDWVVPATKDERRFFVVDISNHRMKDKDYFDSLYKQIKTGSGAFLKYLQDNEFDANVRNPPMTDALKDQILESLTLDQKWLMDKVTDGFEFGATLQDLIADLCQHSKGKTKISTGQAMGRFLKNAGLEYELKQKYKDGTRTVYFLQSIEKMQAVFCEKIADVDF